MGTMRAPQVVSVAAVSVALLYAETWISIILTVEVAVTVALSVQAC